MLRKLEEAVSTLGMPVDQAVYVVYRGKKAYAILSEEAQLAVTVTDPVPRRVEVVPAGTHH